MQPESRKAAAWSVATTPILGVLIVVGSRDLAHFDAALVAYTFAVLFAFFHIFLQLCLLTATMNAWLGSDAAVVVPAALASLVCLELNVGLLFYLDRLE